MTPPVFVSRLTIKCSNPKCKRFLCTVKIYSKELGKVAEINDIKCRNCKHITSMTISGEKVDDGAKRPGAGKAASESR
jgi:hypothetical protein